jgi:hypothetical protein
MRKLITFFSAFAFFSLIFIGCQSSEDITSPAGDLDKPVVLNWSDPSPIVGEWVDLVAGQHNVVGKVYITKNGAGDITVRYTLNSEDCKITEVHVDIAKDLGIFSSTLPGGFHVNSQGNPQHGLFDKNVSFGEEGTFDDVVVTFLASEIQQWLGVSNYSGKLYIAAHAGVCCPEGTTSGDPEYCLDLSEYVKFSSGGPQYNGGALYTFEPLKVYDVNSSLITQYDTWCIDLDRSIERNVLLNARFISTACDPLPSDINCIIEYPENLDVFNYFINHYAVGDLYNGEEIQSDEYQAIIWKLLEDKAIPNNTNFHPNMILVNALVADLLIKGNGFKPGCDEKMAILVVNKDWDFCANPVYQGNQPLVIWKTIECTPKTIYGCETAYGFKYPADGTSSLFPNHVWFRYNGFTY